MFNSTSNENVYSVFGSGDNRMLSPYIFYEAEPDYYNMQRLQDDTSNKLRFTVLFANILGEAEISEVSFRVTTTDGQIVVPPPTVTIETDKGTVINVSLYPFSQ